MADPRILSIPVPTTSTTTHFQIGFSDDLRNWTTLKAANVTDIPISALSDRKYTLDGVNTTVSSTENRPTASTPPMWYRIRLKATSTYGQWLPRFVVPSQEDFLYHIKRRLKDPSLDDGVALLDDEDYWDHLGNAIKAFEVQHADTGAQSFTTTSGTQSYSLPDAWDNDFSYVTAVEYPVRATDPRDFISPEYVFVDERQAQWRFVQVWPNTSESARIFFTKRHARDGSSIPTAHFESVALWAAGDAAEHIQILKNQFGDVMVGADYVSVDPRIKTWGMLAKSLKEQAEKQWGQGRSGVRAHVPAYDDHGRIPRSILSYG